MEMIKKQITLPDGRTLIYFSFPKKDNKQPIADAAGVAGVSEACSRNDTPSPYNCHCCGGEK